MKLSLKTCIHIRPGTLLRKQSENKFVCLTLSNALPHSKKTFVIKEWCVTYAYDRNSNDCIVLSLEWIDTWTHKLRVWSWNRGSVSFS